MTFLFLKFEAHLKIVEDLIYDNEIEIHGFQMVNELFNGTFNLKNILKSNQI